MLLIKGVAGIDTAVSPPGLGSRPIALWDCRGSQQPATGIASGL